MERKLMKELIQWKTSEHRKPLIIRGTRQVGKTWLMKEFGKTHFEQYVYVNFDENKRIAKAFDSDINPEALLPILTAETGISITPEKTLIIFDEVQEAPRALSSLKYFCERAPEYPIIAAGSFLGIALHEGTSFPVGKVTFVNLYPLSYQEFLCALGDSQLSAFLDEGKQDMISIFKEKYTMRLKQYYYVGGMPEAVLSFSQNHDFMKVRSIQKNLLDYYSQDFSKHAQINMIPRLNMVWQSIPLQLAKENKKFFYGQIKAGGRAKNFELAIQWLADCGLIHKLFCVNKPHLPLIAYCDFTAFKLYLHDVGLLSAMGDLSSKVLLDGNDIFTEFKGALSEQYVIQEMIANGASSLFYYSAANSRCEIDVLWQKDHDIIPIEVKAEENLQAKSLKVYRDKFHPNLSLRLSMSDYREQDWMINIPLYELSQWKRIVSRRLA